ncbi:SirB2 family protein [Dyella ginsengisoli]|uniref:SirB2 family protein n=1 Tax=Dyella ginsengisoli TaxID=363848 RepID=UPI00034B4D34|nr:SirB2 family protein [Dyella ginsengisoli]
MFEFYPQIKAVHIACVILSGLLFALRGTLVQAGRSTVAHWAPLRYLSYSVDTVLLTAALMLLTILPGAYFANGWLTVKLVGVVFYVICGSLALKRARSAGMRRGFFAAALLLYVGIVGIAWEHHPLGWLHAWAG